MGSLHMRVTHAVRLLAGTLQLLSSLSHIGGVNRSHTHFSLLFVVELDADSFLSRQFRQVGRHILSNQSVRA